MKNKPLDFNVTLEVPYHVGEVAVLLYFRPGSPELAEAVIEAMQEHDAVLLSNHGKWYVVETLTKCLSGLSFSKWLVGLSSRAGWIIQYFPKKR